MSTEEVFTWLLRFAQVLPHTARNAYSALFLIPGWEFLNFARCIKLAKRLWNVSEAKYADFWDAKSVLQKLQKKNPVNWHSVQQVLERCILILRLFHLCRSINLAQAVRTSATMDQAMYVMLERKGQSPSRI